MKNFLMDVCLVSARKRRRPAPGGGDRHRRHGRRDENDIKWLPAILIIKAWKKLWCQEKKQDTHTVRLTKCM